MAQFGTVDESRYVIEGSSAEQRFHNFNHKNSAVGSRNGEIAAEEQPHLAQRGSHAMEASAPGSRRRPVRRRKASSKFAAAVRCSKAASVSQASKRPLSITAMRSASISTSGSV